MRLSDRPIDSAFDDNGEAGQALRVGWDASEESKELVVRVLTEDARRHLQPGTIFEIRAQRPPANVGDKDLFGRREITEDEHRRQVREWGIAWYYAPGRKGGGYESIQISDENDPTVDESIVVPIHPSNGTSGELFQHPIGQAQYDKVQGVFLIARIKA